MTIVSTAALSPTVSTTAIVSEFAGGQSSNVAMTIGIGLVKDSDAVYFRYADEAGEQPIALLTATGRHLSTLGNVTLVDVGLYEPGDEYKHSQGQHHTAVFCWYTSDGYRWSHNLLVYVCHRWT